jgi:hypothetical protein
VSPQPDDLPNTGELGQDPEAHERQLIRELAAARAADKLNEAQANRPLRENFGANEQESWDDPHSTSEAIAGMKASRAPALVKSAREAALRPTPAPLPQSMVLAGQAPPEMALMVQAVVGELSRELRMTLAELKEDIDANTRLLGVMNAPMEAITNSHERAASSFETLRADIASIAGSGSSPAIEALTKVVDTAGLGEATNRAEKRMEQLALNIDRRMTDLLARFDTMSKGITLDMTKVLHLLDRLQARQLREAKNQMKGAAGV